MKRSNHRQAMIELCLTAFLVFGSPASAQRYKVIDLGTLPGGAISNALGVNDHAQVVGVSNGSPAITHAFSWTIPKGMKDLGTLGGNVSWAEAINDAAQIVGQAQTNSTADAFLWEKGIMQDLGSLSAGATSQANAINYNALSKTFTQIAGWSLTSENSRHAVIWDSSLNIVDLGTLGGTESYAFGNNCRGQVVGVSGTSAGGYDPFVWDAVHGMQDLGTLGGTMAGADGINCFGIIVGESSLPSETQTDPFVFINGFMQDLGGLGGSYGEAKAVNDAAQVVGTANVAGDTDKHAFLWTPNTGLVDLNKLIPGNSGWDLQGANSISYNGRIVGAGLHNGQGHAFLLVPAQ